jgi:hypothetical protein
MGSLCVFILQLVLFLPSVLASVERWSTGSSRDGYERRKSLGRVNLLEREPTDMPQAHSRVLGDQAALCKPYLVKETETCLNITTDNHISIEQLEGFNKKTWG